jgi:hypothetical protein
VAADAVTAFLVPPQQLLAATAPMVLDLAASVEALATPFPFVEQQEDDTAAEVATDDRVAGDAEEFMATDKAA